MQRLELNQSDITSDSKLDLKTIAYLLNKGESYIYKLTKENKIKTYLDIDSNKTYSTKDDVATNLQAKMPDGFKVIVASVGTP